MGFEHISVYYPRGLRTGGPEALHQLVDSLRRQGQSASLVPLPGTESETRVYEYRKYDAPERAPLDSANHLILAPERGLGPLRTVRKAQRAAWWLSIDNSKIFWNSRRRQIPELRDTTSIKLALRGRLLAYAVRIKDVHHLTQSHYAWNYVSTIFGITPSMTSDYTPLADLPNEDTESRSRKKQIAFNPAKGAQYVDAIAAEYRGVRFIPIAGMSRSEVLRTLAQSAVYLDLGNHPGKDRLPREAVVAGAVTLVGKRGAAANSYDLPIPWDQKIDMTSDYIARSICILNRTFANLEAERAKQSLFRAQILGEQTTFDREVRRALIDQEWGFDRISVVAEPQE